MVYLSHELVRCSQRGFVLQLERQLGCWLYITSLI